MTNLLDWQAGSRWCAGRRLPLAIDTRYAGPVAASAVDWAISASGAAVVTTRCGLAILRRRLIAEPPQCAIAHNGAGGLAAGIDTNVLPLMPTPRVFGPIHPRRHRRYHQAANTASGDCRPVGLTVVADDNLARPGQRASPKQTAVGAGSRRPGGRTAAIRRDP